MSENKIVKIPEHLKRWMRIPSLLYDYDHLGKSMKRIAYEQCTTVEVIEYIIKNRWQWEM
jgi:hypothetical protein